MFPLQQKSKLKADEVYFFIYINFICLARIDFIFLMALEMLLRMAKILWVLSHEMGRQRDVLLISCGHLGTAGIKFIT